MVSRIWKLIKLCIQFQPVSYCGLLLNTSAMMFCTQVSDEISSRWMCLSSRWGPKGTEASLSCFHEAAGTWLAVKYIGW